MSEVTPVRIRIRYDKNRDHYYCYVFISCQSGVTYEKCGELVFSEQEWPYILKQWPNVEFIEYGSNL